MFIGPLLRNYLLPLKGRARKGFASNQSRKKKMVGKVYVSLHSTFPNRKCNYQQHLKSTLFTFLLKETSKTSRYHLPKLKTKLNQPTNYCAHKIITTGVPKVYPLAYHRLNQRQTNLVHSSFVTGSWFRLSSSFCTAIIGFGF